jgi:hypothetical protein
MDTNGAARGATPVASGCAQPRAPTTVRKPISSAAGSSTTRLALMHDRSEARGVLLTRGMDRDPPTLGSGLPRHPACSTQLRRRPPRSASRVIGARSTCSRPKARVTRCRARPPHRRAAAAARRRQPARPPPRAPRGCRAAPSARAAAGALGRGGGGRAAGAPAARLGGVPAAHQTRRRVRKVIGTAARGRARLGAAGRARARRVGGPAAGERAAREVMALAVVQQRIRAAPQPGGGPRRVASAGGGAGARAVGVAHPGSARARRDCPSQRIQ